MADSTIDIVLSEAGGPVVFEGEATGAFGGSIPFPVQSGAASPYGSVTPSGVGAVYVDTTHGAAYVAIGATNADWVQLGGKRAGTPRAGVNEYASGGGKAIEVLSETGTSISDVEGANNSGNGIFWLPGGADGNQYVQIVLGTFGAFTHEFSANGTYHNANGIFFPTADPHIAGAWWDNAGTLTKSSG